MKGVWLGLLLLVAPAPTELVLPGVRMHVQASENLDADRLRALGQGGAVLWVTTGSNVLRESTLEALQRAPEAYVQVRAPVLPVVVRQLSRVPRVGIWVDAGSLSTLPRGLLGPRRLAVEIKGSLTAGLADAVVRARPTRVEWRPDGDIDLLSWARFRQLPGAKLVRGAGGCEGRDVWVEVELGRSRPGACPGRLRVTPQVSDADLLPWYAAQPGLELEVDVGADEEKALEVLTLLAHLSANHRVP